MVGSEFMLIELPKFLAKKEGLPSLSCRVLEIEKETNKSFLVEVESVFSHSFNCWSCGKIIKDQRSIHWGVGPDCAARLGIPYEEAPEDSDDFIESKRKKLYLSKGILTEEQAVNFRTLIKTKETEADPTSTVRLWKTDTGLLAMSTPWLNKKFVDELKVVPNRKWDPRKKITTFAFTDETVGQVSDIFVRWKLLVSMDDQCEDALKRATKANKHIIAKLEEHGVTSTAELKGAEINLEDYDWGLKTSPWPHQRQAILYAATLLGLEVPKKET